MMPLATMSAYSTLSPVKNRNSNDEPIHHKPNLAMASESQTTSVHITVYVAPENAEKYLEIFKDVFATISAEPELRYMEVYQALDNPGTISWVENW